MIKEEKNIRVGRSRKAKFINGASTTPALNDLKRKSLPASEKLSNFLIAVSTAPKNGWPIGVFKIIIANINCKPRPQMTNLQGIDLRLLDIATAIANKTRIPKIPMNRSIYFLGTSKQFLHRASYISFSPITTCSES